MKKLLLLLILSFFSIQSYAGSCPDGSDPVRSISADGTYFVYNCGGDNSSSKKGNSATSSKNSIAEIKKSMDDDGILEIYGFGPLNAPHAINPISVNDFSKIGKTSLRFETNDGECGQYPRWNDCQNDRERTELNYETEFWKTEKWYRFYLYLPKDYNSVAPGKMSLIQWKRLEPSKVLVMFKHTHAGLVLNRNAETFADSYIVLKPNEELLGSWTEIIFNTNWHPDSEKGVMKVWIDGKLKVDVKGRANINSLEGRELSLRYGLYSSFMSNYKKTFNTKKMPQRIAFYDGVKAENSCQKLLDINTCNNLVSQNINEYKLYLHQGDNKELHSRSICKISSASFESATSINDFYNPDICPFVKPADLFTTIEASDTFDGSYSFVLSRYNPSEGSMKIGSGILEISDGKISVAKKSRLLKTSSPSYYNTFEGQIDKEGGISAVFDVNALNGQGSPIPVDFTGSIDELELKGKFDHYFEMIIKLRKIENTVKEKSKTAKTPSIETTSSDPTISKVIKVIQGDKFIVEIAEPHELAGTDLSLSLRDIDAPDAVKSCPKQLEFGNQVKDFVAQKIAGATSLKITNFRKTSKAIIGQVIIDGKDLGAMLIQNGYASDEYGYWKGYFCSALNAIQAGISNEINGDYEESIFWYERALIIDPDGSNNSQATYALSKLYKVSGDDKKSLGYLKQSADLNYMKAQEDLGSAYINGIGVSKNLAQAKKWLKKAHDNGSKNAENICGCEF